MGCFTFKMLWIKISGLGPLRALKRGSSEEVLYKVYHGLVWTAACVEHMHLSYHCSPWGFRNHRIILFTRVDLFQHKDSCYHLSTCYMKGQSWRRSEKYNESNKFESQLNYSSVSDCLALRWTHQRHYRTCMHLQTLMNYMWETNEISSCVRGLLILWEERT